MNLIDGIFKSIPRPADNEHPSPSVYIATYLKPHKLR